jgi:hypothetical protein
LVTEGRVSRLKEKVATVKAHMEQLKQIGQQLRAAPDGQVSLTDPDARSMATSGRGTGIVGYNVQTAVDTKHHLIVAHEVTNVGHDRTELASMAKQARSATGKEELTIVADRGYFSGKEILECDQAGMTPLVPKPLTSNSKAEGRFDKRDFVYIAEDDEYRCPAGQRAIKRFTTIEHGMTLHKYWSSACPIDGRPRFVKRSLNDGEKVKIAAIDPDFCLRPLPRSLMESADGGLISEAHSKCIESRRLTPSRSYLSCHHLMIA